MSWNLLKALLKNYAEVVITLTVRFSTGFLFDFESPSLFPLTPTPRPCQVCHCLLHLNVFHLRLTVSSTFVHRRKSFPLCDAGFVSSFCASFFPAFFTLVCVCVCDLPRSDKPLWFCEFGVSACWFCLCCLPFVCHNFCCIKDLELWICFLLLIYLFF